MAGTGTGEVQVCAALQETGLDALCCLANHGADDSVQE